MFFSKEQYFMLIILNKNLYANIPKITEIALLKHITVQWGDVAGDAIYTKPTKLSN